MYNIDASTPTKLQCTIPMLVSPIMIHYVNKAAIYNKYASTLMILYIYKTAMYTIDASTLTKLQCTTPMLVSPIMTHYTNKSAMYIIDASTILIYYTNKAAMYNIDNVQHRC